MSCFHERTANFNPHLNVSYILFQLNRLNFKDQYSSKPFQPPKKVCTSNINAFILIFLYYAWGKRTSNYKRKESGLQKQAFTIYSAPDKLLHLCQQMSIAVSSPPPALGSFHTMGLQHLLLPGFFLFNCVFAVYLHRHFLRSCKNVYQA